MVRSPGGIEALGSDDFSLDLLDLDETAILHLLQAQADAFHNPSKTLGELLDGLGKTVPRFVKEVRKRLESA